MSSFSCELFAATKAAAQLALSRAPQLPAGVLAQASAAVEALPLDGPVRVLAAGTVAAGDANAKTMTITVKVAPFLLQTEEA
jgi:hypothetical protein